MALWIYLHFPSLQLDTLLQGQSLPSMTATAIIDQTSGQICQCDERARHQGLKIGMGLGSAASLCSDLSVHPYNPEVESTRLYEVARWLYLISSDIVIDPSQGLWLKASDMLALYGGLEAYWQAIIKHLCSFQLEVNYGCGYSPLAAKLLANAGTNQISDDSEQLTLELNKVPLTLATLQTKSVEKLARVGIHHIEQLLDVPMKEVARRFDIELVNFVGRLIGQFKHPMRFYHPETTFSLYQELLYEIENIQWLEKPIYRLLEQMERYLHLRGLVVYELSITFHQRDKQEQSVSITSAQGDYIASRWQTLSALRFESLALQAPITGITLSAIRQGEPNQVTHDIFDGEQGAQSAMELFSLLQAKLGKAAIMKPTLNSDPRPERASHYLGADSQVTNHNKTIASELPLRPSVLLPDPIELTQEVSLVHGPERIVSGWWDGDEIMRDYFIAQSSTHQWLWVFRDQRKRWFLHGYFC